jgi:predicted nucleic acid-binding protein
VADGLILETTFLIDLERERHRREEGAAHRFLRSRAEERLYIAVMTAGEIGAGVDEDERQPSR